MKRKLLVALFFAALTLIGLLTSADYGLPCDEPAEQVILRENLKEYAIRFGDENAVRYYDALGINRIGESIERDHGQAAYYLAAPLLTVSQSERMTTLYHAYTWLWFMVGVAALYLLARELGLGTVASCASSLLLYLSPRFFAEGHYNNKDMVLLSLVLATFAFGARLLRDPCLRKAIPFSLAGALATNTKIVGAMAWGLIGLALLVRLIARRELKGKPLAAGLWAIGLFVGFYAALTPALWYDPLGYFPYVLHNAAGFSRWTGVVIFEGAVYDPTNGLPLPRLYLPKMIAYTVPTAFLLLAAVGQIAALIRCARSDKLRPLLIVLTLCLWLPMGYVVAARPILYNGWRHFYFLYAAIAAFGALGIDALLRLLKHRRALQTGFACLLAIAMGWQAVGIATNHPYQYAYYSPLAGAADERFELDYWDVSTVNAMRALLSSTERDASLPLELSAQDDMSLFGVTHGYDVLSASEQAALTVVSDDNAPYLFANTTYAQIYGTDAPTGYRELLCVNGYGHTLCRVYERISSEV